MTLQQALDLAHDIREKLPHLNVYLHCLGTLDTKPYMVWVRRDDAKRWFDPGDTTPISHFTGFLRQYRIFTGWNVREYVDFYHHYDLWNECEIDVC